jgi:Cu(I)/Ag(I) efflux system membrane fusion protein
MNRIAWIGIVALVVVAGLGAGYWMGTRSATQSLDAAAQGGQAGRKVLYYRNPMGLPDTSPMPKKDPMGMDYVPVYEGEEAEPEMPAGTVKISLDKVQLLGVRSEPAALRPLIRTVRAVGTIQANEQRLYTVAPRFEGWIEKLHVNTTGQSVRRGQPLMDVYSPDLVTAQEEYLIALRGAGDLKDSSPESRAVMLRLADDALRRLRNLEISDHELKALQQDGQPSRLVTYRSSANGVVLRKPSVEGMRFMSGDVLFEIADLSSVWVLADVSEQDVGLVQLGQEAKLDIVAYPGKAFTGKVLFLYPTIDTETRTAKVRIELANPGGLLKPAMFANVELVSDHARGEVLAVPESAVLDSGARQLVLVRRGEGLFEPRMVRLGMRADGYIEVAEGLQAGEEVVVRANFLIDAESNLKAALETFGGHGGHGAQTKPAEVNPASADPAAHEGH